MCGIVGYIGDREVVPVLTDGLEKLEYRGYDSAGVAFLDNRAHVHIVKQKGRLKELEKELVGKGENCNIGIGHTRWATHGEPSYKNAHPHTSATGDIAIVHNGIIENYRPLMQWLQKKGIQFESETDTEVIVHLINYYLDGDLKQAVRSAMDKLEGSYALAVVCEQFPDKIIVAKKDSPLVIGMGKDEQFVASDIPALLAYTRDVYFMQDGELAVIQKDGIELYNSVMQRIELEPYVVDWDIHAAEKEGYEHFMIKEIEEQPKALADTLLPRIQKGEIDLSEAMLSQERLASIEKVVIVACGTAYHAGFVGKVLLEQFARVPTDVEIASEYRYKNPILHTDDLVIVLSQSGETADTIAAMREAQKQGVFVLAICNVVGSTIAREADAVLYTRAGLEIAVASTKAYTTQLMCLYMLCANFAYAKGKLSQEEYHKFVQELEEIPAAVKQVLTQKAQLQKYAANHFMEQSVFYLGRGLDYALAMEASLKLKEISYVHSEAYAAGELKHGTIALIEPGTLAVTIVTQSHLMDKSINNAKEVAARGGKLLAVTQERNANKVQEFADQVITIPDVADFAATIPAIVPMQLFAYYMSVQKGCDVDKPRNLAKSVTVE